MGTQERLDLSSLTEDGDTLELADGRLLRLRVEPDPDFSINDYDADGKIAWGTRDDYGEHRPAGFDGSAEKLNIYDHGVSLWWQPYEGLTAKHGSYEWEQERRRIQDLATYGFVGLVLELCQGKDAYARPIVVRTASLWGIESTADDDYRRELINDLASELEL